MNKLWTISDVIFSGLPSEAPTIDIFNLDYPRIINILDYPSNHFL